MDVASLLKPFAVKTETNNGLGAIQYQIGYVSAEGRTVLEPMTGSAANDPYWGRSISVESTGSMCRLPVAVLHSELYR